MPNKSETTPLNPQPKEKEELAQSISLDFTFRGKRIMVSFDQPRSSKHALTFTVSSLNTETNAFETEGVISGNITITGQGLLEFESLVVENHKVSEKTEPPQKLPGHLPGLMAETIRQLILQDIFSKWTSSYLLTDGAHKMYQSLQSDPGLNVTDNKVVPEATRWSYSVTKSGDGMKSVFERLMSIFKLRT